MSSVPVPWFFYPEEANALVRIVKEAETDLRRGRKNYIRRVQELLRRYILRHPVTKSNSNAFMLIVNLLGCKGPVVDVSLLIQTPHCPRLGRIDALPGP